MDFTNNSSDRGVHRDRVVAVVSAYLPDFTLVEHCIGLLAQVWRVVVVDDGSGEPAVPVLQQLETLGVEVVRQRENLGIAAAMNRGFDVAVQASAEFVVTFDQDSEVPEGFIDALVNEYDRCVSINIKVGMVAPEFFSATPQTRMNQTQNFMEAYAPIQSGLLMPLSVVRDIGPQREDFFIDLVDTEYYLRARNAGYEAACVPNLTLPHGFGHRLYVHAFGKRLRKRSGRPRMVAVSSPFRYYYRVRNRVVLNKQYLRQSDVRSLLKRDTRLDVLLDFCVALYSARGKVALGAVMFAGLRDGLRGTLGKIPAKASANSRKVSWRHPV